MSPVLPKEIIYEIVDAVAIESKDWTAPLKRLLENLSLVSKDVRNVALKHMFRKFSLQETSPEECLNNAHLLKFVETLEICASPEVSDGLAEIWNHAISLMKNLKHLIVKVNENETIPAVWSQLEQMHYVTVHFDIDQEFHPIPKLSNVKNVEIVHFNLSDEYLLNFLEPMEKLQQLIIDPMPKYGNQEWAPYHDKVIVLNFSLLRSIRRLSNAFEDENGAIQTMTRVEFPRLHTVFVHMFPRVDDKLTTLWNWLSTLSFNKLVLHETPANILLSGVPMNLKYLVCDKLYPSKCEHERERLLEILESIPHRHLKTSDLNPSWEWTRKLNLLNNCNSQ